jgi:hypothetical protein
MVFEPKIPVFEWAKTAYVLDRAATVIGGALACLVFKETVSEYKVHCHRK